MNTKEYAERMGVPVGTVKRWRHEGMPGTLDSGKRLHIDVVAADVWVAENRGSSVAFHRRSSIYIAQRDDGAIKIGWSSDVLRRVCELRKDTFSSVTLLAVLPGDKSDELRLHARFARSRIGGGEWFRATPDVEAFIASLRPKHDYSTAIVVAATPDLRQAGSQP